CMHLHGIAISPDGAQLYVIGKDSSGQGTLDVLDTSVSPPLILSTSVVGHSPFAVAASPDGAFVYIPSPADQTLLVFSTSNLRTPAFVVNLDGPPRAVAFSADSTIAYVGVDSVNGNSTLPAIEFFTVETSPPAVMKRAVVSACCFPDQM